MQESGSVTISVRLTNAQYAALKEESEFTGATVSKLVRKGAELYLAIEHPVVMHAASKRAKRKTNTVSVN